MTPKTDLYELVQSLTPREVRAFREEVLKRRGEHVYIQLFEKLLETTDYDEEQLKMGFEGKKTLNNFSIAKNNLYEKLLDVLCILPHHHSIETRFDLFRQQISILVKKSLYKQAMARVNKAINLAEKLEAYRKIYDLHDLQREIGRNFLQPQDYLDLLRALRNKELWLKEVDQNLQRYRDMFDTSSIAQKVPSNIRGTMISSILNHQLLQDESECRSVSARLYFYRIWNHLYFIQGRETGWKYYTEHIIQLLEENQHLLSDPGKFIVYVNTISDLGLHAIAANEFAIAMEAAGRLKTMRKNLKTSENEALIFTRYWKLQLLYSQKLLDEKNGMTAVAAIREGLRQFKGRISKADAMELHHIVSVFLLTTDRSSEALTWILELREQKLESSRPDLHYYSWLLFLVAHYNLRHFDVIEQQIPGTVHYLRERKAYTPLVKLLITIFKKAANSRSRGEEMSVLRRYGEELNALLEGEANSRVLEYFDFRDWIEAQIEGIPLHQLLRRAPSIAKKSLGSNE